ncbi:MAG: hypothetical protein DLM59_04340 [Pseudonocardiales bacterium]|nr:MAG: hypothetical protein DLM59_04340 [Pseudonocardiales bacterium]
MSEPLELAAVQRDDVLLDRLARRDACAADAHVVAALLAGLRADICADEDPPSAEGEGEARRRPVVPSARRRAARPAVAGLVAAAFLLSATGVAAAASRATPGSVLWPVAQVVAPAHVHSVMARERVLRSLAVAKTQAGRGDSVGARASLDDAISRVDEVHDADGRSTLEAKVTALRILLDGPAPAPGSPPAGGPLPSASPVQPSPGGSPEPSASPDPSPAPSPDPTSTPDPSVAPTPGTLSSPAAAPS